MKDGLLSTTEVKELTGIKTEKLRYLYLSGKVTPAIVTDTGRRYYTHEQVMDIIKELKIQTTVAYSNMVYTGGIEIEKLKEIEYKENEEHAAKVRKYIKDTRVTPIYDIWNGKMEGSKLLNIIRDTSKGLVVRVVIPDKRYFDIGSYTEFKRWFGYLGCELLDLNDLKQREEQSDAGEIK